VCAMCHVCVCVCVCGARGARWYLFRVQADGAESVAQLLAMN
jgi:hypothetical protein